MHHQGPVKKAALFMAHVFAVAWSTIGAGATTQELRPVEEMRAVIYTAQFAQRFALPTPPSGSEPVDGIQAMEFSIETASNAPGWHMCKLAVFLDSKISVAYPEGDFGVRNLPSRPSRLMTPTKEQWEKWSIADKKQFHLRSAKYRRSARLATPNYVWQQSGWSTDVVYDEYDRNLFTGLAYIKIDLGCPNVRQVRRLDAVQLWLKREGGKDYSKMLKTDPDDFLKFSIPRTFLDIVLPWWEFADEHNPRPGRAKAKSE